MEMILTLVLAGTPFNNSLAEFNTQLGWLAKVDLKSEKASYEKQYIGAFRHFDTAQVKEKPLTNESENVPIYMVRRTKESALTLASKYYPCIYFNLHLLKS